MCEPGKLTPEEQELINSTMRKTHVLDSYAYMVRQRDSSGRENSLIYTILMKPIRLICLTVDYEYKGTILGGLS